MRIGRRPRLIVAGLMVGGLVAVSGVAVVAPASASVQGSVASTVVMKPSPKKPQFRFEHVDKSARGMYQEFILYFSGGWKGTVTVTAYTFAGFAQVFQDVKPGQVISVKMTSDDVPWECSAGTFEITDSSGHKLERLFAVRYNTV